MDEATIELFAIDVVPKVAEVCCVSEFPIFVPASPMIPEILCDDGVCDVECPAFSFVGYCSEVEKTLCLEGLSEPNEHLMFFVMEVDMPVSQDTINDFPNGVFVECCVVGVLVDVVLRRILESLVVTFNRRRLLCC